MLLLGIKNLRFLLDSKFSWTTHLDQATQKTRGVLAKLRCLTGRRSKFRTDIKRQLSLFTVQPLLYTYKIKICKLQIVQNKALREIANARLFIRMYMLEHYLKMINIRDIIIKRALITLSQDNPKHLYSLVSARENPIVRKHRCPFSIIPLDNPSYRPTKEKGSIMDRYLNKLKIQ